MRPGSTSLKDPIVREDVVPIFQSHRKYLLNVSGMIHGPFFKHALSQTMTFFGSFRFSTVPPFSFMRIGKKALSNFFFIRTISFRD